jgi:hypothetical protein
MCVSEDNRLVLVVLHFLQEWDDAKAKQDKQLDRVGGVVDRLKEIANNMGDEVRGLIACARQC